MRVWSEQPLRRNVKRFRGWLVFKAQRLLNHSTLGSRAIKKKGGESDRRGAVLRIESARVKFGLAQGAWYRVRYESLGQLGQDMLASG